MALKNILRPSQQVQNAKGEPLGGGIVELLEPGTNTPVPGFKDSELSQAWGNEIKLSGSGRANVWVTRNCDMRIYDRNGNLVIEELEANPDSSGTEGSSGLATNGSFETDSDSDGVPDGWLLSSDASSSNEIDDSESTDGAQSFRFTSNGSGGGSLVSESFFPVNDSENLRITVDLLTTNASLRNIVRVEWYDISQVAISNTDAYDEDSSNPTSWTTQNLNAEPPSGARFAKIKLIGADSGTSGSGNVFFDNLRVFYPEVVVGVFDNLTIQNNEIISTNTNGDIDITPNGTGAVNLGGLANVDNLRLDGNTLSSTNTDGDINITPNGSGAVNLGGLANVDNLRLDGNTLSSTNSNGDINITPNGSGKVVLGGRADVDNLSLDGNTLSSTNSNGDINITPNGTGAVKVNNLSLNGNTLSSTNTDGDINITPNGTGKVVLGAAGTAQDYGGTARRVGWVPAETTLTSSRDLSTADLGNIIRATSGTLSIVNVGSGTELVQLVTGSTGCSIAEGSGMTVRWLQGGSSSSGSTLTIAERSTVSLRRVSSTEWELWGNGIS